MREAALRKLKVSTVVSSVSSRVTANSRDGRALEEGYNISVNLEPGDKVSGAQERIIGDFSGALPSAELLTNNGCGLGWNAKGGN